MSKMLKIASISLGILFAMSIIFTANAEKPTQKPTVEKNTTAIQIANNLKNITSLLGNSNQISVMLAINKNVRNTPGSQHELDDLRDCCNQTGCNYTETTSEESIQGSCDCSNPGESAMDTFFEEMLVQECMEAE